MSKRRCIVTLLVCVALAALAMAVFTGSREPSYGGRTLSQWLEIYRMTGTPAVSLEQSNEAAAAVRAIGTDALPCLLKWIRYEPANWQRRLSVAISAGNAPRVLSRFAFSQEKLLRSFSAVKGFEILGPAARPALPPLVKLVDSTPANPRALEALAYLGMDAVSPVAQLLTNANHPLHRFAPKAAVAMTYLGTNASPLVPLLVGCANDTNWNTVADAVRAIGSLRLMPETSVTALTNCLRHSNPTVRFWAAESLRHFKSAARPALWALGEASMDREVFVRDAAAQSLFEIFGITPESIIKAPLR